LAALLDYGIALALSSVMLAWYGITPDAGILLLPALVPIFFLAATGAGMLLSALNVQYRDVRYAIPFVIQIGLFLSLVIFPASVIPQSYRWMIYLNPMAGVVEAHRAAILPGVDVDAGALAISAASTAVLFVVGAFYFKRVERSFADVI
jgi:lipopolysaccharide transport system permease protein